MERLVVRFAGDLPCSIRRLGVPNESYLIPKAKRLQTLQFMMQHPQHVLKKRKTSWEVVGIPPPMRQRGGNRYGTFLRAVKKVLAHVPDHPLAALPLTALQQDARVKELYERHFKHVASDDRSGLLNYRSVLNTVASNLLDYDTSTGLVRDSVADVRARQRVPSSTIPDLELRREHEFDRLLLLALERPLAAHRIPGVFLKSTYFTSRPQLQQAYMENAPAFQARLEGVRDALQAQVWHDYQTLVNETNRIYLSRYPFQEIALNTLGLTPATRGFTRLAEKLRAIVRVSLAIPGSGAKFNGGLEELSQTFARSREAKVLNVDHFMLGLHDVMTNDRDFVVAVVKNGSRIHAKVLTVLRGRSLSS